MHQSFSVWRPSGIKGDQISECDKGEMIMDLQLIRATANDAQDMLNMQKKCFEKHFERYQDLSGSPYNEVLEKMI
jgi:hypothetical protein